MTALEKSGHSAQICANWAAQPVTKPEILWDILWGAATRNSHIYLNNK